MFSSMSGLGIGYQFYSWGDFLFSLACKYFMGAIVAGANVMEPNLVMKYYECF